jgi:hypothetical protein
VAISADSGEEARNTVVRHYLTFPVLYHAVPATVAKTFGAHLAINEYGTYIESTGSSSIPTGQSCLRCTQVGPPARLAVWLKALLHAPDTLSMTGSEAQPAS